MNGSVHVYYGDGKGKTTAALGMALRAAGFGMRVVLVQFLKGTDSSELVPLKSIGVTVLRGTASEAFLFAMTEEEKRLTRELHDSYLEKAYELIGQGKTDMLILDESLDAYSLDMLDKELLLKILDMPSGRPEVVLTGHKPVEELLIRADYINEIVKHRHPYDSGIPARKGIEY